MIEHINTKKIHAERGGMYTKRFKALETPGLGQGKKSWSKGEFVEKKPMHTRASNDICLGVVLRKYVKDRKGREIRRKV